MKNNNVILINVDNIFTKETVLTPFIYDKSIGNIDLDNDNIINTEIESKEITSNIDSSPNVFIRPVHCYDEEFLKLLKEKFLMNKTILFKGYDNILKVSEKNYDVSLHYLNYDIHYMNHLTKILNKPVSLFSIMCDPLLRAVTNYRVSNSFNKMYDFNEYYMNFGTLENVGWTGKNDRTNNYFANYLGFKYKKDITKENIQKKYAFILVAEKEKESYLKLLDAFNIDKQNIENSLFIDRKETDLDVNANVKKMFIENNILDYELYDLCVELLQDN